MKILINNETYNCPDKASLASIIELLDCESSGIALALNNQVVHKDAWSSTALTENDQVDVFQVVAGG